MGSAAAMRESVDSHRNVLGKPDHHELFEPGQVDGIAGIPRQLLIVNVLGSRPRPSQHVLRPFL